MNKNILLPSIPVLSVCLLIACGPSKEQAKEKHIEDSIQSKQMFSNVSAAIQAKSDSENGVKLSPIEAGFRKDSIKWSNALGMPPAVNRLKLDSAKGLTNPMTAGETNQFCYIDFTADHYLASVMDPSGPTDSVEWNLTYFGGVQIGMNSIRYLSVDGENHYARLIVKPSTDPAKGYDVHFESKKFAESNYQAGPIVILDANKTPWVVNVDYPKSKAVMVFTLTPYKK